MKTLVLLTILVILKSLSIEKVYSVGFPQAPDAIIEIDSINHSFDFLKAYPTREVPIIDAIRLNDTLIVNPLSGRQKELLSLDGLASRLGPESIRVSYRVNLSNNFISIVFNFHNKISGVFSVLVNYDLEYNLVDYQKMAFHNWDKDPAKGDGQLRKGFLSLTLHTGSYPKHKLYLISAKGNIIERIHPTAKEMALKGIAIHERVIKAPSGLTIRDSVGNKIGKYEYGHTILVTRYSKDSIALIDEGKKVWGRKAEVILDKFNFMNDLILGKNQENVGYVFEGFLYKQGGFYSSYENYMGDENDKYHYYFINYLNVSKYTYTRAKVDIREFLELEKVDFKDYQFRILAQESVLASQYYTAQNNEFKLKFWNGAEQTIKDTTYLADEYSPTHHYELFDNETLTNYYLIYKSFFEGSELYLLNKERGDTTYVFADYPFVSPNKKRAVSIRDRSYLDGATTLEIIEIDQDQFKHVVTVNFINWHIPNDKHIYWISDSEFILEVKEVDKAYSDETNARFFYLKFKIKI
ncbi:MAG: hypothetical protein IIA45_05040 [Bacteroidetes bacterium]|nr:hypothetical protein [Bacteroidota bacterium]